MINLCPKLIAKAVSIDDEHSIEFTMQFLSIAKKLKIRKFGLNTFNDPDLIKIHKSWPFDEEGSAFSITKTYDNWPAIWRVRELFTDWVKETYGDKITCSSGCGNQMQAQLPHVHFDSHYDYVKLITGIYTLSKDKQTYDFVEAIPYKETAEYKRPHKKNESYF